MPDTCNAFGRQRPNLHYGGAFLADKVHSHTDLDVHGESIRLVSQRLFAYNCAKRLDHYAP